MNHTLEEVSSTNDSNTILILSISFTLMFLSYISIYTIYCRKYDYDNEKNKKYEDEYEPLFHNYGTYHESNIV